jgi:8-oxo-dGTP pyrophosphatase MutT (NUDIX family)
MTTPVTPRPAATCVLMRPRAGGGVEVFMVRRHIQSEFAPDVYVFPGGSVTEDDQQAEQTPGLCAALNDDAGGDGEALGSGFRVAALRECFEEAGVLLARHGAELLAIGADNVARIADYRTALQQHQLTMTALARQEGLTFATDALTPWAHWITPAVMPKRFDTHFFLAEMPASQEAAYDRLETTDGVWIVPEEASAGYERGDFPLVFAQIHQLRELHGLRSYADARARFAGRQPRTIMPQVVERDGKPVILLPDEE